MCDERKTTLTFGPGFLVIAGRRSDRRQAAVSDSVGPASGRRITRLARERSSLDRGCRQAVVRL